MKLCKILTLEKVSEGYVGSVHTVFANLCKSSILLKVKGFQSHVKYTVRWTKKCSYHDVFQQYSS